MVSFFYKNCFNEKIENFSREEYCKFQIQTNETEWYDYISSGLPHETHEFDLYYRILNETKRINTVTEEELEKLYKLLKAALIHYNKLPNSFFDSFFIRSFFSITHNNNLSTEKINYFFDRLLFDSHQINSNPARGTLTHTYDDISAFYNWVKIHDSYRVALKLPPMNLFYFNLEKIQNSSFDALEIFKLKHPAKFIEFISMYKTAWYYENKSKNNDLSNDLILEKSLDQIISARNNGIYNSYYELLESYYSEKLKNKPGINFFLKYFVGYGEKPWRLFGLFFLLNVFFAFVFVALNLNFNVSAGSKMQTFLNFVYFNNTTMLTIGYGDIYPVLISAKICVIILQLLGFSISTAIVALFLRKIFRY